MVPCSTNTQTNKRIVTEAAVTDLCDTMPCSYITYRVYDINMRHKLMGIEVLFTLV